MAAADLEVVGVVRRRHLDRTGAEGRVDVVVGDDRDPPAGERQLDLDADQVLVASVVRVHGDGGVAEHGLGPRGGDDDRGVTLAVPDRDQLAVVVGVLDLDVRQRGQAARAPVDDPLGPVDEAVVEHPLEDGLHRAGQALIHREPLTRPVHAVAEPAHLAEDLAAGLGLPLPDPLDEGLPAQVMAGQALPGQLSLHDVLRGDAGVVHTRKPQRVVALHSPAPGQRVHQRVFERVAEVQRTGDVGGRDDDAERGLAGVLRPAGREVAAVDPPLVERAFYLRGNELARQVGAGPRPGWVVGGLCHGHAGMVRIRSRAMRTAVHSRRARPQIRSRTGSRRRGGSTVRRRSPALAASTIGEVELRWWRSRGARSRCSRSL